MKATIHQQTARIGLAMSSPVRLRALNLMAQRPWRVGELAAELSESTASTSAHLKVLRAAHMVEVEKLGRDVWCRIAGTEVVRLLSVAQHAAENLMPELREVEKAEKDDDLLLKDYDLRKLSTDVKKGHAILVDLRPVDEFSAGHFPGAQSWPFDSLSKSKVRPLKSSLPVVTYCRGRWCLKAREGVETLNKLGIPAKRLPVGVVDWQAAGLRLSRD